jgi:hypothetical protein
VTEALGVGPPAEDDVLDFTVERKPFRFRVDDDIFEAVSALPTMTAFELTGVGERMRDARSAEERRDAFIDVFRKILQPSSLDRFIERLSSNEQPIDAQQLIAIVQGLLSRYGLRPTEPSGSSLPPPPGQESGTPSTDSSPWPDLTPVPFPSTGS